MIDLARLPPQNQEAERCVLGAILRNNRAIDDVVLIIRKEDFYADGHQKIFETMVALNDQGGRPVDTVILHDALLQREWLADVGGAAYLAGLWDCVPSSANVEYYARIVREKALLRNLILTSNETLGEAYSQTMPADQLIESAQRRVAALADRDLGQTDVEIGTAVEELFDQIDRRAVGDDLGVVPTGFNALDRMLGGGLHPGELAIVAARPSAGKTAFATNLARLAGMQKRSVFFVSLEQRRVEIAERLIASVSRINAQGLRLGRLQEQEVTFVQSAADVLRGLRLTICDVPTQSAAHITARARRRKRNSQLNLLIIDYLQLIEPESRRDPRHEQVAQISRRLKLLARELDIPVVALAQVNRASEDRSDRRPRLSDLRESGSLEQDADAVLMLHQPDREPGRCESIIEVIVAKNRNGPTGAVQLAYDRSRHLFTDPVPQGWEATKDAA